MLSIEPAFPVLCIPTRPGGSLFLLEALDAARFLPIVTSLPRTDQNNARENALAIYVYFPNTCSR